MQLPAALTACLVWPCNQLFASTQSDHTLAIVLLGSLGMDEAAEISMSASWAYLIAVPLIPMRFALIPLAPMNANVNLDTVAL